MRESKKVDAKTVLALEPGTFIRRDHRHFVFQRKDAKPFTIPLLRIKQLILGRGVGITVNALSSTFRANIPVTFEDYDGSVLGMTVGPCHPDASTRLAQYEAYREPAVRLMLAKRLVEAKLTNAAEVLWRFRKNHPAFECLEAIRGIRKMIARLDGCADLATVRGCEGMAARLYFEVFGGMLLKNFEFQGRTKQPPRDPVNALLSYGYTILGRRMAAMLEWAGLDPYFGFLHELQPGRPSLALDLIEPLRPVFVDRLVLNVVNREQITPSDFETAEPGEAVWLTQLGRQKFLAAFESFFERGLERRLDDVVSDFKQALMSGAPGEWRPIPTSDSSETGSDRLNPFDGFADAPDVDEFSE